MSPRRGRRRRPPRAAWVAAVAALALTLTLTLALTGCSPDDPSAPGEEAATEGSATPSPPTSVPATGEAQPIPPTPEPLPVLATAAGSRPGTSVTVHELRRSDEDSVRLVFTVSNRGPGRWVFLNAFNEPGLAPGGAITEVGGTYLVDEAGDLKYLVLRDTENACICSESTPTALNAGSQFTAFAEFPAPPEDVTAVTVVVPQFNPLPDIPISG